MDPRIEAGSQPEHTARPSMHIAAKANACPHEQDHVRTLPNSVEPSTCTKHAQQYIFIVDFITDRLVFCLLLAVEVAPLVPPRLTRLKVDSVLPLCRPPLASNRENRLPLAPRPPSLPPPPSCCTAAAFLLAIFFSTHAIASLICASSESLSPALSPLRGEAPHRLRLTQALLASSGRRLLASGERDDDVWCNSDLVGLCEARPPSST